MDLTREVKFKKARKWLIFWALVLVAATVLSWGIASNWGKITYTKITQIGANGEVIGGILAMPEGANDENPVPVVVSSHGAGSQAIHEIAWAIEYARRGYAVILVDANGNESAGLTGYVDAWNSGETAIDNEASLGDCMICMVDYAKSQKWCDGRIVIQGLSMGGLRVDDVLRNGEEVDCAVEFVMYGYLMGITETSYFPGVDGAPCDFLAVYADSDHFNAYFRELGFADKNNATQIARDYLAYRGDDNADTAEEGVLYGSFEENNAFMTKYVHSLHPSFYLAREAHEVLYDFVGQSVPTDTALANDDLIYPGYFWMQAVCILAFILSLAQFAYFLTLTPTFYPVLHTPIAPAVEVPRKKRIINCGIELLYPFILFFPVTKYVSTKMGWLKPVFRSTYINPIIFWLLSTALVSLAIMVLRKKKTAKERTLTAADFGTGPVTEEKKFSKERCVYGAVIGIVTTLVAFTWMDVVIKCTGLSYSLSAWAAFTRMTPERLVRSIPYVIVILFIVTIINIGIATTRRFPSTGNELKDNIRDVAFNVLMSVLPLTIILIEFFGVGYLRGTGIALLPHMWHFPMVMPSCMTFPVMMGSSAGISTYLYKKTGNIYAGTITATLILGLFTVANAVLAA